MLYDEDIYADGANNAYQFFDLTKGTGGLSYLARQLQIARHGSRPELCGK
jgi:hypothetical protein